ncbi:hypothetical protein [Afipia broomeae]
MRDLNGELRPGQDWRMEVTGEFQNPDVRAVSGSTARALR